MKKILSMAAMAAAVMALSSCNTDGGDTTSITTIPALNVVTDMAANKTAVSLGTYTVDLNFTQGTMAVATRDLTIDSSTHSFSFDAAKFSLIRYVSDISLMDAFQVKNPAVMLDNNSSMQITNSTFGAANRYYLCDGKQIDGAGFFAQYNVGNQWLVRALPTRMIYVGTTTTNFDKDGVNQPYTSTKIVYVIDFDKTGKKANVQIPNAQFSDQGMPSLNLLLKDIDVTWSMQGFSLSGKDLACNVVTGNSAVPNDNYKFATFDFSSTSQDMMNAASAFRVVMTKGENTATYTGQFNGSANPNTKKD